MSAEEKLEDIQSALTDSKITSYKERYYKISSQIGVKMTKMEFKWANTVTVNDITKIII